jgi:hypothetical protein
MKWEKIDQAGSNEMRKSATFHLERTRLPHGWLVRSYFELRERIDAAGVPADIDTSANVSITFVPLGPAPWA